MFENDGKLKGIFLDYITKNNWARTSKDEELRKSQPAVP